MRMIFDRDTSPTCYEGITYLDDCHRLSPLTRIIFSTARRGRAELTEATHIHLSFLTHPFERFTN